MKSETEKAIKDTSKVRAAMMEERQEAINIANHHIGAARQSVHSLAVNLQGGDYGGSPLDAIDSLARLQGALYKIRAITTAIEMIDIAGLE